MLGVYQLSQPQLKKKASVVSPTAVLFLHIFLKRAAKPTAELRSQPLKTPQLNLLWNILEPSPEPC